MYVHFEAVFFMTVVVKGAKIMRARWEESGACTTEGTRRQVILRHAFSNLTSDRFPKYVHLRRVYNET